MLKTSQYSTGDVIAEDEYSRNIKTFMFWGQRIEQSVVFLGMWGLGLFLGHAEEPPGISPSLWAPQSADHKPKWDVTLRRVVVPFFITPPGRYSSRETFLVFWRESKPYLVLSCISQPVKPQECLASLHNTKASVLPCPLIAESWSKSDKSPSLTQSPLTDVCASSSIHNELGAPAELLGRQSKHLSAVNDACYQHVALASFRREQ